MMEGVAECYSGAAKFGEIFRDTEAYSSWQMPRAIVKGDMIVYTVMLCV